MSNYAPVNVFGILPPLPNKNFLGAVPVGFYVHPTARKKFGWGRPMQSLPDPTSFGITRGYNLYGVVFKLPDGTMSNVSCVQMVTRPDFTAWFNNTDSVFSIMSRGDGSHLCSVQPIENFYCGPVVVYVAYFDHSTGADSVPRFSVLAMSNILMRADMRIIIASACDELFAVLSGDVKLISVTGCVHIVSGDGIEVARIFIGNRNHISGVAGATAGGVTSFGIAPKEKTDDPKLCYSPDGTAISYPLFPTSMNRRSYIFLPGPAEDPRGVVDHDTSGVSTDASAFAGTGASGGGSASAADADHGMFYCAPVTHDCGCSTPGFWRCSQDKCTFISWQNEPCRACNGTLDPSDFWQCLGGDASLHDSCRFIAPKDGPLMCPNPEHLARHRPECSRHVSIQGNISYMSRGTNEYERIHNDCACPACNNEDSVFEDFCEACGTIWRIEFDPDYSVGRRSCDMCHDELDVTGEHYMCPDCDFECHPACTICSCSDDRMCMLCAYNMNHKWITIPAGTGRKLLDVRNRLPYEYDV